MSNLISQTFNLIPPQPLVMISRGLQALATPIVVLLITTAATLDEEAKDAISSVMCYSSEIYVRQSWC